MLRDLILEQLYKAKKDLEEKNLKLKSESQIKDMIKRLGDNQLIIEEIKSINFIPFIPKRFKEMTNPYDCFFDRINFFYDPDIINKFPARQVAEIFFCEFFNNKQNGYLPYNSLTNLKSKEIRNISLLMMYHIGFIRNKLWYSLSGRKYIYTRMIEEYSTAPLCFEPNQNTQNYFFEQLLFNNNNLYGEVINSSTTNLGVKEAHIIASFTNVNQHLGIYNQTSHSGNKFYQFFYKMENNQIKKLTGNNEDVILHKELIGVANALSQ